MMPNYFLKTIYGPSVTSIDFDISLYTGLPYYSSRGIGYFSAAGAPLSKTWPRTAHREKRRKRKIFLVFENPNVDFLTNRNIFFSSKNRSYGFSGKKIFTMCGKSIIGFPGGNISIFGEIFLFCCSGGGGRRGQVSERRAGREKNSQFRG